jgi:GNAT superfamily N-acetyltransferase
MTPALLPDPGVPDPGLPAPAWLAPVMEATWSPARSWRCGPFVLRDGAGGGKRVSAATCSGPFTAKELDAASAAMGEEALFCLFPHEGALDAALAARGYRVVDPVVTYAAPVAALAGPVPPLAAFAHWPPLAIARDLWAEGGIGAPRQAVMERVAGPKAAVLARIDDRPAGVAFVAVHGDVAMLHALEVGARYRRQGAARHILRVAAAWAQDQGAGTLSLLVTTRNSAARALYASARMTVVGQYHYRMK